MRAIVLSFALSLFALTARGFEIEEELYFEALGTEALELRVLSTTDADLFEPIIRGFQQAHREVAVHYVVVSSSELSRAIAGEGAVFDLAISSAMDLQVQLANDGLALSHSSDATQSLPVWGRWHDRVFAFTQEPASIVLSRAAFEGLELPQTRQELITLMRENAEVFSGRIGTYDVRQSGAGYLFATQDGRTSETYWRLTEVMGALQTRLYCCSAAMIEDVASGELALAYNVVGSYAHARSDLHDDIHIIAPQDFTTVMLRTALIPSTAENPEMAGAFIDHLIDTAWHPEGAAFSFPGVSPDTMSESASLRPIQLGPGLLVYLDRLKRSQFLSEWEAAMVQSR